MILSGSNNCSPEMTASMVIREPDLINISKEQTAIGFHWRETLGALPFAGMVIAAGPHLKSLTTIFVEGVQFDWLFYGLAIIVVLSRPLVLFQRFPLKFFLFCFASLGAVALQGLWNPGREILDLLSIWLVYSATYFLVKRYGVTACFHVYVALSAYVAIFGIFELLTGQVRAYGLDGLSFEPSHYAVVVAPAAFFAIMSPNVPRWMKLIIPVSLLLTLSTTGLSLFAIVMVGALRKRIFLVLLFALVGFGLWQSNEGLRDRVLIRVQDEAIAGGGGEMGFGANRTTASLLSNWYVARTSFVDFFPFGSGFSNHYSKYEQVFRGSSYLESNFYGTNVKSGHNLAIRWISEFGLIGVVAIVLLIRRAFIVVRNLDPASRIILLSCSMHLVGKSMKLGSYLDYGTPFFVSAIFVFLSETSLR